MKQGWRGAALALCAAMLVCGCAVKAEETVGEAEGYGGRLRVSVSMAEGRIREVRVLEHHETEGVGTKAIDALPRRMAEAGSAEVDGVSGATVTSNALKEAVRRAVSLAPAESAAPSPFPQGSRSGMGMAATGRVGPGVDGKGETIHSMNIVFAGAVFDGAGRILHIKVDQLEIASPNAAELGMQTFTGWPGSDAALLLQEPVSWQTKRELGGGYTLGSGTWAEQMDAYERLFTGMTVTEVRAWFEKHCSAETGRPLLSATTNEAELAQYAALDDASKAALTDVTTAATMSLRGVHGDILTAIEKAWENAQPI